MTKIEAKVLRNANRAQHMNAASTRDATEKWLEDIGTRLCQVWFYVGNVWVDEKHVDDHDTFLETVGMSQDRLRARYAMWSHDGGSWTLLTKATGETRTCPTREAAEMIAIHNG